MERDPLYMPHMSKARTRDGPKLLLDGPLALPNARYTQILSSPLTLSVITAHTLSC